jgi:predicted PurR-regulated permease PerM
MTKKIYVLLIVVIAVVILIYAQTIIIPFFLAIIFWIMIRVIKKAILRIRFLRRWPDWIFTVLSTLILFSFLVLIVGLITKNIQYLSAAIPQYQSNLTEIKRNLSNQFNIDLEPIFSNYTKQFEFTTILSSLLSTLTGLFGGAFAVFLYLFFLLLEEATFSKKIRRMYPDDEKFNKVNLMISKIDNSVQRYIALKTIVSLSTGLLSYFTLLFIGVDAPAFWAFLIFVLNYIPNIGSLIATLFPAIFALFQFGELTQGFLVLATVGSIQMVIGNFVEPKLMGNSLNISPLVVLLTLAAWGVMWGITGMLLSVPITIILIIIMAEFPSTRPIAILLSQDGQFNKGEQVKK